MIVHFEKALDKNYRMVIIIIKILLLFYAVVNVNAFLWLCIFFLNIS